MTPKVECHGSPIEYRSKGQQDYMYSCPPDISGLKTVSMLDDPCSESIMFFIQHVNPIPYNRTDCKSELTIMHQSFLTTAHYLRGRG